jgi:valyl-tRNA synthetase
VRCQARLKMTLGHDPGDCETEKRLVWPVTSAMHWNGIMNAACGVRYDFLHWLCARARLWVDS